MSIFVVDVEATGPCPGLFSMVSFGVVKMEKDTKLPQLREAPTFFSDLLKPLPGAGVIPEALNVSNVTVDDMEERGRNPVYRMTEFAEWVYSVNSSGRPMFFSDNNGFDWQFMNYYFHYGALKNPFGHSSTNIGSLFKGLRHDMRSNFKRLRKTKHTHHPVDDARGNAEALIQMRDTFGLRL